MNKIIKSDLEWKKILSEDEYYVTRQKGTEPAFSGKAFDISKDGMPPSHGTHFFFESSLIFFL